jgi:hypothetical protein
MAALAWGATSFLLFLLADAIYGRRAALIAASLFSLSSGFPLLQAGANTEAFMLLPLAGSALAFARAVQTGRTQWLFVAGVCGGLAALTKQVAVLHLAAFVFLLAQGWVREKAHRRFLIDIAVLTAGSLVALGVVLVPFALGGALGDFFYANVTYNRIYSSSLGWGDRAVRGITNSLYTMRAGSIVTGFTLLSLLALRRRRLLPGEDLLLAGLVASAAGVLLSGWFFPHYFVSLLPFAAALAGGFLVRPRPSTRERRVLIATASCLTLAMLYVNVPVYVEPSLAARHAARFPGPEGELDNATPALGAYLRANTVPDDTIFNYGRETSVYFYADRRPAIRYLYDRPFWLDADSLAEAMEGLKAAPPAFIVDSFSPQAEAEGLDVEMPSELSVLLADEYEYAGRVEFAELYRLKDSTQVGRPNVQP